MPDFETAFMEHYIESALTDAQRLDLLKSIARAFNTAGPTALTKQEFQRALIDVRETPRASQAATRAHNEQVAREDLHYRDGDPVAD